MKHKLAALLFFTFLIYVSGFSQTDQIGRIEIDLSDEWGDFFVIPMQDKGIILGSFGEKDNGITPVKFIWYDSNFEEQNAQTIQIPKSYEYVGSYNGLVASFTLFYDFRKGKYIAAKCEYGSTSVEELEGAIADDMYVKSFVVLDNTMFALLNDKKKASISIIDLNNGSEKRVELHEDKQKIEAINIQLVQPGDEIHVFYHSCEDECKNLIKRFDRAGNEITGDLVVKSTGKDYVMDVNSSKVSNDRTFVISAYGKRSDKTASGFMVGLYDNSSKASFSQNYNFLDLEHFTDYLPEYTKNRIERKQQKKEKKGEELELDYYMHLHEVKQLPDNQYLVAGEFYYASSRNTTYTTYTNGVASTQIKSVFDGYQYTHSLLAVFDDAGQKVWSHIFPMYLDQKPWIARKNLRITVKDKQVQCLYANFTSINSITFEDGVSIVEKGTEEILPKKEGEEIRWAYKTDIMYWYPNHFLLSGYQNILKEKNDESKKKKRRVFFLTDVIYEGE
jgi:hypothetical protein